jgi:hypothetical protein
MLAIVETQVGTVAGKAVAGKVSSMKTLLMVKSLVVKGWLNVVELIPKLA